MNTQAERHLVKAEDSLSRGEKFYRQAAGEIEAALRSDASLTRVEIGKRLGRSDTWVDALLAWARSEDADVLPFSEPKGKVAARHAKGVLANADDETLGDLVDSLPAERVEKVAGVIASRKPRVAAKVARERMATDDTFAQEVMDDPKTRMRTAAAIDRHRAAAGQQVESEETARRRQTMNQEELDGLLLMEVSGSWYRVVQAATTAARETEKKLGQMSGDARQVCIETIRADAMRVGLIADAAVGDDLDSALDKILSERR